MGDFGGFDRWPVNDPRIKDLSIYKSAEQPPAAPPSAPVLEEAVGRLKAAIQHRLNNLGTNARVFDERTQLERYEMLVDGVWLSDLELLEATLAAQSVLLRDIRAGLEPFARFFKSDDHDLSPADDNTIVAMFQDQSTKLPLAELWLKDFRAAAALLARINALTEK